MKSSNSKSFVILKMLNLSKKRSSKTIPVIILNNHSEILEFSTFEEAQALKEIFEANTDSGWTYIVKEI